MWGISVWSRKPSLRAAPCRRVPAHGNDWLHERITRRLNTLMIAEVRLYEICNRPQVGRWPYGRVARGRAIRMFHVKRLVVRYSAVQRGLGPFVEICVCRRTTRRTEARGQDPTRPVLLRNSGRWRARTGRCNLVGGIASSVVTGWRRMVPSSSEPALLSKVPRPVEGERPNRCSPIRRKSGPKRGSAQVGECHAFDVRQHSFTTSSDASTASTTPLSSV